MTKSRIARIARLVELRQQQRRIREAEHAEAQRALDQANERHNQYVRICEDLDQDHNGSLENELDPSDLELICNARTVATKQKRKAQEQAHQAAGEAEKSREILLDAYRAHRSLEIFHDKARDAHRREVARAEQHELDEFAQRPSDWRNL